MTPTKHDKAIGRAIRDVRKATGLSLAKFAEVVGWGKSIQDCYERGELRMSLADYRQFRDAVRKAEKGRGR